MKRVMMDVFPTYEGIGDDRVSRESPRRYSSRGAGSFTPDRGHRTDWSPKNTSLNFFIGVTDCPTAAGSDIFDGGGLPPSQAAVVFGPDNSRPLKAAPRASKRGGFLAIRGGTVHSLPDDQPSGGVGRPPSPPRLKAAKGCEGLAASAGGKCVCKSA